MNQQYMVMEDLNDATANLTALSAEVLSIKAAHQKN